MSLTTDRNDPNLEKVRPDGQQETYLVLSEEERNKGYVRPVRQTYKHVGVRPQYPIRDLTAEELERFSPYNYIKYEEYPEREGPVVGKFWTEKTLNSGCNQITTMALPLAETYATNPKFYGATFCSHCQKHFPVSEFIWEGTNEQVGS